MKEIITARTAERQRALKIIDDYAKRSTDTELFRNLRNSIIGQTGLNAGEPLEYYVEQSINSEMR